MLMGQNLDVSYRGKVVHIQTEDLGRNVAKVMTQVFHSGAILDSKTVSYADEIAKFEDVGQQNDHIRQLMLRLSKWFHKSIHSGAYDAKLKLAPLPPVDPDTLRLRGPKAPTSDAGLELTHNTANGVSADFAEGPDVTSPGTRGRLEESGNGLTDDASTTDLGVRGATPAASRKDAWLAVARTHLSGTTRAFSGDVDFGRVDEQLVGSLTDALKSSRS
jgi:hypothetical protein